MLFVPGVVFILAQVAQLLLVHQPGSFRAAQAPQMAAITSHTMRRQCARLATQIDRVTDEAAMIEEQNKVFLFGRSLFPFIVTPKGPYPWSLVRAT